MGTYVNSQESLVSVGGNSNAAIATGSSTTTIKNGPGRLCRIVITAAGTAAFTVYDNTAGSGTALFVSPTSTSVGTIYDLQMPAMVGITVVNVASGPAITVSFI